MFVYMSPVELQLIPYQAHSIFNSGLKTQSGMKCRFGIMLIWIAISLWNEIEKFGIKSTFSMAEIKAVCKRGSFIHVPKCISSKVAEKMRWSVRMI